jgi:hypothetical protein
MFCSPSQCTGSCASSRSLTSPLCSLLKLKMPRGKLLPKKTLALPKTLYIVKEIIAHKITRGRAVFLVVWRDYPGENSWEPFRFVSRLDAFRDYCKHAEIVARSSSISKKIPAPAPPPAPPLPAPVLLHLYKDDEITEEAPDDLDAEDPELPPIPYDSDSDSVAKVRPPTPPPPLLFFFSPPPPPTGPEDQALVEIRERERGGGQKTREALSRSELHRPAQQNAAFFRTR